MDIPVTEADLRAVIQRYALENLNLKLLNAALGRTIQEMQKVDGESNDGN